MVKHRQRKLLVEGGGDRRRDLRAECRKGFTQLLDKWVKLEKNSNMQKPRVVPCGSRHSAYQDFCRELANAGPDDLVLLLVDSEAPVTSDDPWEHVKQREGDGWTRPNGASADHLHLMVEVMESWFLADPDALGRYFGKGFRHDALPKRADIESIAKLEVYRALEVATKDTKSGRYGKGAHSFEILGQLDPQKLAGTSRSAARLFRALAAA